MTVGVSRQMQSVDSPDANPNLGPDSSSVPMRFAVKAAAALSLAVACCGFIVWLFTRPYWTVQRVDCGNGRMVTLLRPNELCDVGGPVHFDLPDITPGNPPAFAMWSCGSDPDLVCRQLASSETVVLVDSHSESHVYIMIDYQTGWYWPSTWHRKVTDKAKTQLADVQAEFPEMWLADTYDGSLTGSD